MVDKTPIHEADKDFWEEQFSLLQLDALVWAMKADNMIRAFELLATQAETDSKAMDTFLGALMEWRNDGAPRPSCAEPPRVGGVALMLGGYALEALFKGVAIQNPENKKALQAKDKGTLKKLFHHRLHDLAIEADIELTPEEALLCERLEQFNTWAGRYPVPKGLDDMLPRKLPDKSILPLTWSTSADYPAVREMIQRLRPYLPSIDYTQSW